MKIIEVIAGFGAGGAEALLKDLSIGIKEENHEVLVIIVDQFSSDVSEISKINQLNQKGIRVISLNRKPQDKSFLLFFKIYKILKEYQPTVVHIHSFLAAVYFFPFAFVFKSKFVQTIHSTQVAETKLQKIFYSILFPLKYRKVYCSETAYTSLKKIIGEGAVISNGIASYISNDIREYIEKEFNIPKGSFIALNVGRIVDSKNQLLLLDLIEKLNNELYKGRLYLLLCGKHYEDDFYLKIISKINQLKFKNNIKLIGVRDNITDLMYSSDLYISSSKYEGLPITVLEAMNTGVPLILSPIEEHLCVFKDLESCYFPETNSVDSYVALFENNQKIYAVDKENIIIKRDSLIKRYNINTTVLNYLSFFKNN
ncbi:hypothetical protein OA88_14075 [Flavobacterium sp. JRM]|nr:hypothetical protein OA88_14075 [Flavobacterium sp. JRM]